MTQRQRQNEEGLKRDPLSNGANGRHWSWKLLSLLVSRKELDLSGVKSDVICMNTKVAAILSPGSFPAAYQTIPQLGWECLSSLGWHRSSRAPLGSSPPCGILLLRLKCAQWLHHSHICCLLGYQQKQEARQMTRSENPPCLPADKLSYHRSIDAGRKSVWETGDVSHHGPGVHRNLMFPWILWPSASPAHW